MCKNGQFKLYITPVLSKPFYAFSKMKMEDKERKVVAKKWEEERRERIKGDQPLPNTSDDFNREADGLGKNLN